MLFSRSEYRSLQVTFVQRQTKFRNKRLWTKQQQQQKQQQLQSLNVNPDRVVSFRVEGKKGWGGGGGVVIRGRKGEHTGEKIAYNPIDEFRHYFKHFGRLLEKIYLFLTPSKTDGSVPSQQGAPTT